MTFTPTRAAGLAALADFVDRAGHDYAETRNFDRGPGDRANVSMLSPYLRYRLVTESEVVAAVRARHPGETAAKFIQEVFWRTYWKGWLELRPSVWTYYLEDLASLEATSGGWRRDYDRALAGATGIDCFDAWIAELAEFGYLHNHARMWFASIWIFTLRLPWQLGAALFWHYLYDGDAASNTLSWRWVAGLQTAGKTYLAQADNIARYTGGCFTAAGLAARRRNHRDAHAGTSTADDAGAAAHRAHRAAARRRRSSARNAFARSDASRCNRRPALRAWAVALR